MKYRRVQKYLAKLRNDISDNNVHVLDNMNILVYSSNVIHVSAFNYIKEVNQFDLSFIILNIYNLIFPFKSMGTQCCYDIWCIVQNETSVTIRHFELILVMQI